MGRTLVVRTIRPTSAPKLKVDDGMAAEEGEALDWVVGVGVGKQGWRDDELNLFIRYAFKTSRWCGQTLECIRAFPDLDDALMPRGKTVFVAVVSSVYHILCSSARSTTFQQALVSEKLVVLDLQIAFESAATPLLRL